MTRKRNTKPGEVKVTAGGKVIKQQYTPKKGRNPKYCPELIDRICELIEDDTYTVKEICNIVDIEQGTFYYWKLHKEGFDKRLKEAQKTARENFAAIAKHSLKKLITGYVATEKTVAEKVIQGKVVTTTSITEKVYKPDTTAVIFTLTNAEPENWKHRSHLSADVKSTQNVSFEDLGNCMDNLDDDELKTLKDIALKVKKLNPIYNKEGEEVDNGQD